MWQLPRLLVHLLDDCGQVARRALLQSCALLLSCCALLLRQPLVMLLSLDPHHVCRVVAC